MPNLERIKAIIKERKARKAKLLLLHLFLFALFALGLIFFGKYLAAFIPLSIVCVLLFIRICMMLKDRTVSFFKKELRGTVINKKVGTNIKDSIKTASYGATSVSPYQTYRVRIRVGTIYVKTISGEVKVLGKFSEDALDFFSEGDEIVRFSGTRYPVILNEPPSRQKWLCPVCGEVNPDGRDCTECGFEFNLIL